MVECISISEAGAVVVLLFVIGGVFGAGLLLGAEYVWVAVRRAVDRRKGLN